MITPTEWEPAPDHPGYRKKVIQCDGCTIEILRPILDEKEQAKRELHVKNAAERVLRDYYKRKEQLS